MIFFCKIYQFLKTFHVIRMKNEKQYCITIIYSFTPNRRFYCFIYLKHLGFFYSNKIYSLRLLIPNNRKREPHKVNFFSKIYQQNLIIMLMNK